ncbi:hypothetical protein BD414DRAFT_490316 [Trametes punicea]|nr:hypothetical protein BD414DRAFT_490316 [Trametes punicea]
MGVMVLLKGWWLRVLFTVAGDEGPNPILRREVSQIPIRSDVSHILVLAKCFRLVCKSSLWAVGHLSPTITSIA